MNVVVADTGFGIGLVAYEGGTGVIRVVVPGHAPVTMGGRLGQRGGTTGAFDVEIHRDGLGLVVTLVCQPAPGLCRTRADTCYQGRRAIELLQGLLQGGLLQGAIGWGQNDLDHLRFATLAEIQQLFVREGLVLWNGNGDEGLGTRARADPGQAAAITQGQVLKTGLGRRARP
ncbi:hypothetical protein D9M71_588140 [compost metagenome]